MPRLRVIDPGGMLVEISTRNWDLIREFLAEWIPDIRIRYQQFEEDGWPTIRIYPLYTTPLSSCGSEGDIEISTTDPDEVVRILRQEAERREYE